MRPIPTAFHIGPLEFHTYGLGLAIAFYVAWRYLVGRVRARGIRTDYLVELGVWVVVSALLGARVVHVLTNWSQYSSQPLQMLEVWHGGLASFGGLLFAVPIGLWVAHRRYPDVGVLEGLDIAVPALALGWSIGRLLGPQLMVKGGGHPTTSWIGMYYAQQSGKRIPVPIIQALEDGALFVLLIVVERHLQRAAAPRSAGERPPPTGALTAIAMVVWGVARALDERLWLGESGHLGSLLVQAGGVLLAVAGVVLGIVVYRNWRMYLRAPPRPAIPGSTQLAEP